MSERPLALATCAALPQLSVDDSALARALEREGVHARPAVWDDAAEDWSAFSGVLIRSCWDYHLKPAAFEAWLSELERRKARVFNPLPTLRWNLSKTYLKECADAGVPVVPTAWLPPGPADLESELRARGWGQAVLKPVVAAGGFGVRRLSPGATTEAQAALSSEGARGAMLQPFLPEIQSEGEWSFIFIDGAFTHAVLKTAKAGEFRIQEEYGGDARAQAPAAELVAQARAALARVTRPWLYARVDAVRSSGALLISEIELLEPSLYFAQGPAAADRLARALARELHR